MSGTGHVQALGVTGPRLEPTSEGQASCFSLGTVCLPTPWIRALGRSSPPPQQGLSEPIRSEEG